MAKIKLQTDTTEQRPSLGIVAEECYAQNWVIVYRNTKRLPFGIFWLSVLQDALDRVATWRDTQSPGDVVRLRERSKVS